MGPGYHQHAHQRLVQLRLKFRHSETQDARLLGVVGALRRPDALVVELADGRQEVTSPRLDTGQARQVAAAVPHEWRRPSPGEIDDMRVHWLATPMPIEVIVGTGRHGTVRVVRLRGGD